MSFIIKSFTLLPTTSVVVLLALIYTFSPESTVILAEYVALMAGVSSIINFKLPAKGQ
jgi:hypothetical protein